MPRTRQVRLLFALFICIGLSSLLMAGYLWAQQEYTLYDGQQPPQTVSGYFQTVEEVVAAAGIELRAEDETRPSRTAAADPDVPIYVFRARAVTVRTVEQTHTYFSRQPNIAAFLQEIGLPPPTGLPILADGRPVSLAALAARPLPTRLEIGHFVTIHIQDGRQKQTVRTASRTVEAALAEAGINLQGNDGVDPPLDTPLEPEMVIQVQRAFPVTIKADGRTISTITHFTQADQVAAAAGITLVGADYVQPGPDVTLRANDVIQVVRVTEDFRLQDEPLPYQTVWQADEQLQIDSQAVIRPGVPGIKRQRIRVRYENGIPAGETLDGEWVAREPVNEIIGYGTKIVIRTLETPEGPVDYWRVARMRVTSYTAASSGKPLEAPDYGITASGLPAQKGVVAVDRSVVPWRSWVYVPGYGIGYVGDTGGGVRGRWIDLGYEEEEFIPWSGYVDVYYLTPVPPAEDINFLLPEVLP